MPKIKTTAQLTFAKLLTVFLLLQSVSIANAEESQSEKKKETAFNYH